MVKLFRTVLVVNLLAYLTWYFFPHMNALILDETEYEILSYAGHGAWFGIPEWGHWLMLFISVATAIGLYCFVPVFRGLYVLYLLANFAIQLSMGMVVLTGIESMVLSFLNITDGVLLSLMFLSSVSAEFRER